MTLKIALARLLISVAALCLIPVANAQTGWVTVTGSNLTDSTGTKVNGATITFTPVNTTGQPLSFKAGGSGQVVFRPVSATVTNGAFTVTLADTNLTNPQNVCFSVTAVDKQSNDSL